MISVIKNVSDVKNLTVSEFLRSTGKTAKLASDEVNDRTEVINFFLFDCNIDPAIQDSRIIQDPIWFQFSLRLPQHNYDDTTNMVLRGNIFHPQKQQ